MANINTATTNELKLFDNSGTKLSISYGNADINDGYSFASIKYDANNEKLEQITNKPIYNFVTDYITLNDKPIWTYNSQGPGTGMNSDMVDGLHAYDLKQKDGCIFYTITPKTTSATNAFVKIATLTITRAKTSSKTTIDDAMLFADVIISSEKNDDETLRLLLSLKQISGSNDKTFTEGILKRDFYCLYSSKLMGDDRVNLQSVVVSYISKSEEVVSGTTYSHISYGVYIHVNQNDILKINVTPHSSKNIEFEEGSISSLVTSFQSTAYRPKIVLTKHNHYKSEIVGLEAQLNEIEGDIDDLEGDVDTINGKINTINGNINTINGNISTINGNITTIKSDVATLQKDSTSMKGDISTLKQDSTTMKGDINTLKYDSTTAKNNITNINGSITTIKNDIDDLIDDLESNINSLEKDIDGLKSGLAGSTLHNHDSVYSKLTHNHDSVYSKTTHNHQYTYSPIGHTHPAQDLTHNHDSQYLGISSKATSAATADKIGGHKIFIQQSTPSGAVDGDVWISW